MQYLGLTVFYLATIKKYIHSTVPLVHHNYENFLNCIRLDLSNNSMSSSLPNRNEEICLQKLYLYYPEATKYLLAVLWINNLHFSRVPRFCRCCWFRH